MVTPELRAYVHTQLAAGVAEKDIRMALVGIGWDASSIDEAFAETTKQPVAQPAAATATQPAAMSAQPQNTVTIGRPATAAVQTPTQQAATSTPTTASVAASTSTPTEKPAEVVVQKAPETQAAAQATLAGTAAARPSPIAAPIGTSHYTKPAHPVSPTLRALTAIDSQFRAGLDKESVRSLLLGVGWEQKAIDEAFAAVEWEQNLLSGDSKGAATAESPAPKLSVVDGTLAGAPMVPTRRTLVAIDTLLRSGVSKGDIRTLLLGVGWEARAIDEAFLAVEWRGNPNSPTPANPAASTPTTTKETALEAKPEPIVPPKQELVIEKQEVAPKEEPVTPPQQEEPRILPQREPAPIAQAAAPIIEKPVAVTITLETAPVQKEPEHTPEAPMSALAKEIARIPAAPGPQTTNTPKVVSAVSPTITITPNPTPTGALTSVYSTAAPTKPSSKLPIILALFFALFVIGAGAAYYWFTYLAH